MRGSNPFEPYRSALNGEAARKKYCDHHQKAARHPAEPAALTTVDARIGVGGRLDEGHHQNAYSRDCVLDQMSLIKDKHIGVLLDCACGCLEKDPCKKAWHTLPCVSSLLVHVPLTHRVEPAGLNAALARCGAMATSTRLR